MLGKKVKCKVTGMAGIAIAKITFLNGCIQYEVQPKKLKDGLPVATKWVDIEQLEIVSTPKKKVVKKRTGGPAPRNLPRRGK